TATAIIDNALGRFVAIWLELAASPDSIDIFGRIGGAPLALRAAVDPPASLGLPFNGILESGEIALFAPRYVNTANADLPLTGSLAAVMPAPPGSSVTVIDGTADYGTIAGGATGDCLAPSADCYAVEVARGPNLPAGEWDALYAETLSNGALKLW